MLLPTTKAGEDRDLKSPNFASVTHSRVVACKQTIFARLVSDQARGLHGGHQRRVRKEEGIARLLRMTRVSILLS